ncbi:Hypothetical protein SMAX5B_014266 [Scophthalmus maximus]|uniref:Uncharacterized protein n=1 Tax=Scophthalmus maximus TaxID=52904 RepID=A0A2U9BH80_SCOMX|nr:Hypothetical protein SMAX5B_014266 [Scophthalmus maximus]
MTAEAIGTAFYNVERPITARRAPRREAFCGRESRLILVADFQWEPNYELSQFRKRCPSRGVGDKWHWRRRSRRVSCSCPRVLSSRLCP